MSRQLISVAAGGGILAAGVLGMVGLFSLREPPAEAVAQPDQNRIRVQAIPAQPEDVTVTLTGYGEVASVRTVEMAAEISGTITGVHPRLVPGGLVREGEILFEIDPRPYQAAVDEAAARIAELDTEARRLKAEWDNDRSRMAVMKRNHEIAESQLDRARKLFDDAIGNKSSVEEAERQAHNAEDAIRLLERELSVYPLRIEEIEQQRAAQDAARKRAELNLAYAQVRAPFSGRLAEVMVERGQYITQGRTVLRIADDSMLEIPVKLDARDARAWLCFDGASTDGDSAWFSALEPVTCEVRWAEDPAGPGWLGRLDRVESFDARTRTLAVVVRVSAAQARGDGNTLPLVSGMFTEVRVPGRVAENVFRLPQSAVTVDRTIFLAVEDRLASAPVEVVRREGEFALVRGSLHPGDLVVTTRLVNVLDGTPLTVDVAPAAGSE